MEAGQSIWSAIIVFDCCLAVCLVQVPASWSVELVRSLTVDAKTSFLVVDNSTTLRSIFALKSGVEGIENILTQKLPVFSREQNSLVGRRHWGGNESIRELLFQSDGLYAATRLLLKTSMDLFSVDTGTGKIYLVKSWECVETPGFQAQADFRIDDRA